MLLNIQHFLIAGCYQGMYNYNICNCIHNDRLQLAALHYNFNKDREQATTKCGTQRYSIQYPKFKKGGYTVRKPKTKSNNYGM